MFPRRNVRGREMKNEWPSLTSNGGTCLHYGGGFHSFSVDYCALTHLNAGQPALGVCV